MIVSKLKIKQTLALRGKRSRNKVSVGEPAEGSFIIMFVLLQLKFILLDFGLAKYTFFRVLLLVNTSKYFKFSTMDI